MASNYIPQVDYTSRDYSSIRDDLIALIPNILPEWTSTDASDFGIALIELFAYMGDTLNYYIDRSANEGFINTATQRSSVLAIANLLNYTPSTGTPAVAQLTFQNSKTDAPIVVPAGTKVATTTTVNGTTTQIVFETNSEVTVPVAVGAVKGAATVLATQGVSVIDEYLGDSDGTAYQSFTLSQNPLISKTTYVVANDVVYNEVSYLIDAGYNDPSYTVTTTADGISYITFGDNISGRIPPTGGVYVSYRVGGGASGNVGPNTLTYLLSSVAGLTVNNQEAAYGGADPESTDSIRFNAPYALTALNRAVSLSDYSALSVQVPSVSKAVADGTVYNNILLYIAPYGDSSLGTPGVKADGTVSDIFTSASTDVISFLTDKAPATTTVTVLPPVYVPINITLNLHIAAQYRQANVKNAVSAALSAILAFDNTTFAEEFVLQYVLSAIATVSGVSYADVTLLTRADATFTGNISASSPTISNVGSFLNVAVGQKLAVDNGTVTIAEGTTILSFDTVAKTITMSANAGGSGSTVGASIWTSSLATTGINNIECATNEIPKIGSIIINPIGGILS